MPTRQLTDTQLRETLKVYEECGKNQELTGQCMGLDRRTIAHRLLVAADRKITLDDKPEIEIPVFPDEDIPTEEIIKSQIRRFEARREHRKSKNWFPVKVNVNGPIGLSFFGDPHVDDNFCDWPTLHRHCEIHAGAEALYGINVGDTTNNWVGRLQRLFGEQDSSQATARKLARWLLADSGVTWLAWILGNHDLWNEGAEILRGMNGAQIPMEDWQARFSLVFPNGKVCKIWVAHNFAGNSIWNTLHGAQRAAHTKAEAHIYACGHLHNWAQHQEESASRDFTYWLLRARGYKAFDDHAEKFGHWPQKEGQTITAIIDPHTKSEAGFVQCYADLEEAAAYLAWKRSRG